MTLGCGGYGGNITSDNISPRHLLNIKRVAYEIRPPSSQRGQEPAGTRLPQVPVVPLSREIGAGAVQAQVAAVLAKAGAPVGVNSAAGGPPAASSTPATPVAFVCEEDVRLAIAQGRTIAIGERTIVTPSARDLAQSQRVFVEVA
jgi:hypothetical protein